MAKVLNKKTTKAVDLASLNPAHKNRSIALGDIEWMGPHHLGEPVIVLARALLAAGAPHLTGRGRRRPSPPRHPRRHPIRHDAGSEGRRPADPRSSGAAAARSAALAPLLPAGDD